MTLSRDDNGIEVTITCGGVELLRYTYRPATSTELSPRPFVHPLRTLAGRVVTADRPDDHPWHQGLSLAVPDVGGTNFWGGQTFVRAEGYRPLGDQGQHVHVEWDGPIERLSWISRAGRVVLDERRVIEAALVEGGWALSWRSALRNVTDRDLRFATPEGNGRPDGNYGGLFWRGAAEFRDGPVRTADGSAALGSGAAWVAFGSGAASVVFERETPGPWFVRIGDYPGVCFPFQAPSFVLAAGATQDVGGRLRIYDGKLDDVLGSA